VHVLLRDPDVRERLVPHRVQRVTDRLRLQFIGLKDTNMLMIVVFNLVLYTRFSLNWN